MGCDPVANTRFGMSSRHIVSGKTPCLEAQGVVGADRDGLVGVIGADPVEVEVHRAEAGDAPLGAREENSCQRSTLRPARYNKRDMADAMPLEQLRRELNPGGHEDFEAVASPGGGAFTTIRAAARLASKGLQR